MQEYMLIIHKEGEHLETGKLSPEKQQEFLNKCMILIEHLKKEGKLISAQPLERKGVMISGTMGNLKEGPYSDTKDVIAGYYTSLLKISMRQLL
jgi:hypothetical protein